MVWSRGPSHPHGKWTPRESPQGLVRGGLEEGRLVLLRGLPIVGKATEEVPRGVERYEVMRQVEKAETEIDRPDPHLSVGTSSSVRHS